MARLAPLIGITALLAPAAAGAQDVTVLAVALGPPLLAAPFAAQYLRSRWLLPRHGTSASLRSLVVTGVVEWLLWLFLVYMVARVIFEEDLLALALAVAGVAAVVLTMRFLGAPHRTWGFTWALAAVFPAVLAVGMAWALVAAFAL